MCLEATGVYSLGFALALQRAKTDSVDAQSILAFLERMPFVPWQPPSEALFELQALTRRIVQLKAAITQERNRLHAAAFNGAAEVIGNDIEVHIRHLKRRIERLEEAGLALIDSPRPIDSGTSIHKPRHISKVGNRYLRAALYMPAWVAIQREPQVKAFYDQLIAAGKKPMQAVVAVMRKLLHAIWGMLKHDQDFDGSKFYKSA